MTADEFERGYAERSGLTVERLRELGRVVRPCACGEEGCDGWQSVRGEDTPMPDPGTAEAKLQGCKCLIIRNKAGRGAALVRGLGLVWYVARLCPLHGKGDWRGGFYY